jgi:hypothetical protein
MSLRTGNGSVMCLSCSAAMRLHSLQSHRRAICIAELEHTARINNHLHSMLRPIDRSAIRASRACLRHGLLWLRHPWRIEMLVVLVERWPRLEVEEHG